MIDIHCHLTFPKLDEIKEKVIADAKKSMHSIITCGLSGGYGKALDLSKAHPNFIFLSLGIHPGDVIKMSDEELRNNLDFITNHTGDIVAVGEIGLDYYWVKDGKQNERCKEVFIKCLDIAKECGLPVILHSRKAEADVFKIVKENKIKDAVFHHYSGNMTLAKEIIEDGYYISIPTIIGTSKNLKKIGKAFPLDMLITETDSPFNSPIKDKINFPYNVEFTLEILAKLRNTTFSDVDKQTTINARKVFNLI